MTEEQINQKARQKAKELEDNQTIGVYDDDESLAYDKGYNSGEVAGYEEGYIAGATENGIQWHEVRKNPNDLPKDDRDYLVFTEEFGVEIRNYFTDTKGFSCRPSRMVLAWCEIPKFEV